MTIVTAGVSAKGTTNVNFNWRLIKSPLFVMDYVVVHELAHLIEANHTSHSRGIVHAKTPTMERLLPSNDGFGSANPGENTSGAI